MYFGWWMNLIYVFCADVNALNNDEFFNSFYSNISAERQNKADAFKFRKDKNLSLGASILLDTGLKKIYNICEKNMVYSTEKNKKPYFKNAPEIHFNISHSETMVAVAFSKNEIGIDIEKIKDTDLKIAKRFFTDSEYNHILKANNSKEFYRLWTLKESFMKVTGLGFSLPLNQFCINFDENNISVKSDIAKGNFYFYENDSIDGYCLSVCSENEIENLEFNIIEFWKDDKNATLPYTAY